jgi:hypothetical protein
VARPNWEYIRVDVLLPDHPKLDGLGAAAKWTLVELWCHCGQRLSDGFVRDAAWRRFGTAPVRRQIVEHGLAERVSGGYQMHDYLDHQRSLDEVTALREKRSEAGKRSGAARAKAKASVQQDVQQDAEQTVEQTANKTATEAEAEAEAEADRSGADAVSHPSRRNAGNGDDDEIDLIISEIRLAAGREVSREHAADVRALLLNGRDVTDRGAYLRKVIRTERDPAARFLPQASSHPSARPVAEAVMAAGLTPNGTPLRGADVAAIAARARAALHTPKGTGP